ncbi:hypothetical protein EDD86DRAFT_259640 [Gorgonomyces haynaldii]|nr:hypothetical protein EDD86DRAFT_259640 [Gorgonomyces haynaldii]
MSPDFTSQWLNIYATNAAGWTQTVGCVMLIYAFFLGKRRILDQILLANGITGVFGVAVEFAFLAQQRQGIAWPIILLLNEVNWIVFECTIVMYSLVKLEPIIEGKNIKMLIRGVFGVLGCAYMIARCYIGFLRYRKSTVMDAEIMKAHSWAFIVWGLADALLVCLLIVYTFKTIRSLRLAESKDIASAIFKSSIPRLALIMTNTLVIAALGLLDTSPTMDSLAWLIKAAYPSILLLDIQITKNMLREARTTRRNSNPFCQGPPSPVTPLETVVLTPIRSKQIIV